MGTLTVTSFITLDNVVESPHLWSGAFQSEDTGELNDAVLREADGLLLGRETYEGFAAAWHRETRHSRPELVSLRLKRLPSRAPSWPASARARSSAP